MENFDDKIIQQLIEDQLKGSKTNIPVPNNKDKELYQLLFKELSEDSFVNKYNNLAINVVNQIRIHQNKVDSIRYNFIIAALIMFCFSLFYVAASFVNFSSENELVTLIKHHYSIILYILFTFALIQIADWQINKKKQMKGVFY